MLSLRKEAWEGMEQRDGIDYSCVAAWVLCLILWEWAVLVYTNLPL